PNKRECAHGTRNLPQNLEPPRTLVSTPGTQTGNEKIRKTGQGASAPTVTLIGIRPNQLPCLIRIDSRFAEKMRADRRQDIRPPPRPVCCSECARQHEQ